MFCTQCGKDIGDNSQFCNGCGKQVGHMNNSQFPQQPVHYGQYPPQQMMPYHMMPPPKPAQFLFITGLVFMILFALFAFGSLSSIAEVRYIATLHELLEGTEQARALDNAIMMAYFNIATVVATFFVLLIFFIMVVRYRGNPPEMRTVRLARKIWMLAGLVVLMGALNIVADIMLSQGMIAFFQSVIEMPGINVDYIPEIELLIVAIEAAMISAVVFDIVFMVFFIVCIGKAGALIREARKEQGQDAGGGFSVGPDGGFGESSSNEISRYEQQVSNSQN